MARILVLVHQAVDTHFPAAEQATRQFTKTVFSESEPTAGVKASPADGDDEPAAFGSDERTSPDGRPQDQGRSPYIPPPPGRPAGAFAQQAERADASGRAAALSSKPHPLPIGPEASQLSKSTRLDTTIEEMRTQVGLDWTMRITLAALFAGIALLIFFTYKYLTL